MPQLAFAGYPCVLHRPARLAEEWHWWGLLSSDTRDTKQDATRPEAQAMKTMAGLATIPKDRRMSAG